MSRKSAFLTAKLQPKAAVLTWRSYPVGAYEPLWFMKELHVNPAEAEQIQPNLKANRSVGVH